MTWITWITSAFCKVDISYDMSKGYKRIEKSSRIIKVGLAMYHFNIYLSYISTSFNMLRGFFLGDQDQEFPRSASTLAVRVGDKIGALKGLAMRLREISQYLSQVVAGKLPMNQEGHRSSHRCWGKCWVPKN